MAMRSERSPSPTRRIFPAELPWPVTTAANSAMAANMERVNPAKALTTSAHRNVPLTLDDMIPPTPGLPGSRAYQKSSAEAQGIYKEESVPNGGDQLLANTS